MNKPVTIMIEDFKKGLIEQVNNSGLHIALIKPIISELYQMVEKEYERVYKQELEQYAQSNEKPKQITIPNEKIEEVERKPSIEEKL